MASRCVSSRLIGNLTLASEQPLQHVSPYEDRSSKFTFLKELPSGLPRLTRTMLCTNKEQNKTIHLQPLEAMVPDSTDPPQGYRYDPEPQLLIAIALLLLHWGPWTLKSPWWRCVPTTMSVFRKSHKISHKTQYLRSYVLQVTTPTPPIAYLPIFSSLSPTISCG